MQSLITLSHSEIFTRLIAALLLGSLIGLERQWKQRTAGLRTNALVSIGACCFAILGSSFPGLDSQARIICQIIPGIGFLGAGVIMRDGGNIKGINTAATLWCSAAIGLFAGVGEVTTAGMVTGFIVVTNLVMRPVIKFVNKRPLIENTELEMFYGISVLCRRKDEVTIREKLIESFGDAGIHLKKLTNRKIEGTDRVEVFASLMMLGSNSESIERIVGKLSLLQTVKSVSWTNKSEAD